MNRPPPHISPLKIELAQSTTWVHPTPLHGQHLPIGSTASSQRPARHTSPFHQISVADGVVVVQTGGAPMRSFVVDALISGAGLGGLSAALSLHAAGIEVRVVDAGLW
jgi:NADPH-dependent 2,4-dienoyl-CoA reductase/sulfur reductase-like enzyme